MLRDYRHFAPAAVLASYLLAAIASWQHACCECGPSSPHGGLQHSDPGHFTVCPTTRGVLAPRSKACTRHRATTHSHDNRPADHHSNHDRHNCLLCRFSVQESPALVTQSLPDRITLIQEAPVTIPARVSVRPIFIPDCRAPPAQV